MTQTIPASTAVRTGRFGFPLSYDDLTFDYVGVLRTVDGNIMFTIYYHLGTDRFIRVDEDR